MKPSAILIAALQVHVRRPRQPVLRLENRQVADARIEPYIQDVVFLAESHAPALRALGIRPGQLRRALRIPDIGRLLAEQFYDAVQNLAVGERLLASLAVEHNDRHAPRPLA